MPSPANTLQFVATSLPVAGVPWSAELQGIPSDTHTVVLELYGANGGIMRIFPRGRTAMQVNFEFEAQGATKLVATARDSMLQTTDQAITDLDVGGPASQRHSSAPMRLSSSRGTFLPAMGRDKPAYGFKLGPATGLVRNGAAFAAPQPRMKGGFLSGITQGLAGTITEIIAHAGENTHKVEFSVSNAEMGWFSPVPVNPGGSTSASVKLTAPGIATIYAKFFDQIGNLLDNATHSIQVTDPNNQGRQPSNAAQPRVKGGGYLSGISQAVIGTIADITAHAGDGVEKVEFSVSNAQMGWFSPVPVSPGGSTSASVTLDSQGTATVYAKFLDQLSNVLGEASHSIEVVIDNMRAPAASADPSSSIDDVLNDMIKARTDAIMNRLKK